MNKPQQLRVLRAKKLGLLLQDARQAAGRTLEDCAAVLDISPADYEAFELASQSPALPQLEVLSYYLRIPLDYFWGAQMTSHSRLPEDARRYLSLRCRVIGMRLMLERSRAMLDLETLAERCGLDAGRLQQCEEAQDCLSLPELETVAAALNLSIETLFEQKGKFGAWISGQKELEKFLSLPEDLRSFVAQPLNRPYIDSALHLSVLPADKLRLLAETLLEITL